jgi:glycosyltransferase involved in cell wall biosynthesis
MKHPDGTPRISVLMSTFREVSEGAAGPDGRGSTLDRAVRSVLEQTEPGWELIVVSSHPPPREVDAITRLIESYGDPRIVHENLPRPPLGDAPGLEAKQRAVARSRGELLAFLDADNRWGPRTLELAARAFAGEPELALVYFDSTVRLEEPLAEGLPELLRPAAGALDPILDAEFTWTKPDWEPDGAKLLRRLNFINASEAVMRREAYEAAGGFRECANYDWWLWLEMLRIGRDRFRHVPTTGVELAATNLRQFLENAILRRSIDLRIPLDMAEHQRSRGEPAPDALPGEPEPPADPDLPHRVSAVIVNYRTPELTVRCAESFLARYPHVPLLVIDNGSGDGSADALRRLAEAHDTVRAILNPENRFHGPALDQGIRACETPYVLALDSDCEVVRGEFLEPMAALLEEEPDAYAAGAVQTLDGFGYEVEPEVDPAGMDGPEPERADGLPEALAGLAARTAMFLAATQGTDPLRLRAELAAATTRLLSDPDAWAERARRRVRAVDPATMLLDRRKYLDLAPFEHHGSPVLRNMADARSRGYRIRDFPVARHVHHEHMGTWSRHGLGLDGEAVLEHLVHALGVFG